MGRRLLVTDDSMMIRELIKELALEAGWQIVGEAANGDEAIELFKQYQPDVTTLDLVMPVHDGLHALRGIRAIDPQAKVLVISAISQTEVLREALSLGASDFIVKPFKKDQAQQALNLLAGDNVLTAAIPVANGEPSK